LYYEVNAEGGRDLWALDLTQKGRAPLVVANSPFEESAGQFSPDGRWVAYQTNDSGRFEIVVQAFPEPHARWAVSTGGGTQPRWSADGRTLYYVTPAGKFMAVPIASSGSTLRAGTAVALFDAPPSDTGQGLPQYAVAPDGRFLVNVSVDVEMPPLTVVLNWNPSGN
jgi:Tol biopolymer transport system component